MLAISRQREKTININKDIPLLHRNNQDGSKFGAFVRSVQVAASNIPDMTDGMKKLSSQWIKSLVEDVSGRKE
jgi:hypothetical protein